MKIIHIDMDAFFASVEQRDRPELRGRPVVVGGSPKSRGVVAAASYEARRFGIRSAMSAAKARRLCPEAVFLYPDFERYHQVSEQVFEILREVTPSVEPVSIDEAYLDVTENRLGEPLARNVARYLRKRIRDTVGLTASAGVGPNKLIAKIASDLKKPDGLVVIPPEKVSTFLEKLPVEKLWGVGPATAERLLFLGLRTAGDIRRSSLSEMEREFGQFGRFLHRLACGEDSRKVETEWEPKSRGTETTFERDVMNRDRLIDTLKDQSEELSDSIKEIQRAGRTITLKLRYSDFETISRSRTVAEPVSDAVSVYEIASKLLLESTEAGVRPVRLIGISVSTFTNETLPYQLWLNFNRLD